MPAPAPQAVLVLFDVDLTLVRTGGAGVRAMGAAFRDLLTRLGVPPDRPVRAPEHAGKTDRWIFRDMCALNGVAHAEENVERFLADYLDHLARELAAPDPTGTRALLPGVREGLRALRKMPRVFVGLLTGNVVAGARAKLAHFGLWDEFTVGAFGSDAEARDALPPIAMARASSHFGTSFEPARTLLIGDAVQDVLAARRNGCRVLAVGTGHADADTLLDAGADFFLPDLSDPDMLVAVVEEVREGRSPGEDT